MAAAKQNLRPTRVDEVIDAIADAARSGNRLAIEGGGSKRDIGKPIAEIAILDMSGFAGVIEYDPPELVLTVAAGTPLAEVEALVASKGQALAFAPFDHGPMFGRPTGKATIGGVIASAVAGSTRLSRGGARDHLLGFEAVSGRAERFVAGAKVVKNVTGYDLPKLMAGSWGRLAAMTQVTLKVLPRPLARLTKLFVGLDMRGALRAMADAMGSAAEVGAAAHVPRAPDGQPITALLLAGFAPSVASRAKLIDALLGSKAQLAPLEDAASDAFWSDITLATPLNANRPLWRVVVPASQAASVVQALGLDARNYLFDWAGGLLWIAYDGDPRAVRATVESAGGHAMLVRAPRNLRETVPALPPRTPGVAALEERVRRAFDPAGVFETGRF